MNPLILVWFLFSSIVIKENYNDLQTEMKQVNLFKQTNTGYEKYKVMVHN